MVRKMNEICRDFPILDQIVNDERLVYLDNAATTQMTPEVYAAMKPYFCSEYFNPSSLYAPAQHEKMVLERARTYLASTINAR